jgi:hypothetical protein
LSAAAGLRELKEALVPGRPGFNSAAGDAAYSGPVRADKHGGAPAGRGADREGPTTVTILTGPPADHQRLR